MFQPIVPSSGYVGWKFLQRTLGTQQSSFSNSRTIARSTDHFRDQIANVRTAGDLVNDRQLLEVALGAFGLSEDIDSRFFIQKILSDGTTDDEALANRLSDKRYRAFSAAFGFGSELAPNTIRPGFADQIIEKYTRKEFERAVGEKDNTLRLALNVAESLREVTEQAKTNTSQWFALMGNPPLRKVFEQALGLPETFGRLDIDQQLSVFKQRAAAALGSDSIADLATPNQQEKLIRLFLLRTETAASPVANGASVALTLLRASAG